MTNRILDLLALSVLAGCAGSQLSYNQRTALQSRLFPGAKLEEVFNHMKVVLNKNHYSIKTSDLQDRIILASRKFNNSGGASEKREEIAVILDNTSKGVQVQISIQTITHYSLGGNFGTEELDSRRYVQFFTNATKENDRIPASIPLEK